MAVLASGVQAAMGACLVLGSLGAVHAATARVEESNETHGSMSFKDAPVDELAVPPAVPFYNNVYLLAYLSGALSFWVTTGTLYYLQVHNEHYKKTWAPRGNHGIDSWRTAFRKAAWNLHVSLPSFVAFCAVLSFKAFKYAGIEHPEQNVRWVGGTWLQMAGTMAVMAFVDDFVFWSAHAGLHSHPYLFKNIHALHHRYHNPIAPAVFYTHPIDFIASYATEFWVGPLLVYLGVLDVFTVCSYNFAGVAGAVLIHAGCPINLPFTQYDVASFHSFHHKMGDSHYGVWGMVDYLFGTLCDFDRLALKEEKMDARRAERMRQGLVQTDSLIGTKAE
jgi:sterol desaturase/sphingolipid hydroxylase (fatty acid hydroxylase superfamily)